MTWLRSSFEWAGDLYTTWFADWLHVDFVIRTVILLLMLWLIIFVLAQLFKFIIGPFVMIIYVNIFKRAWNYLVTETMQEWLYINYYSVGDTKFINTYMRLCDRVKRNRAILASTRYSSIMRRGRVRRLGNYLMITTAIIVALWVGAFGLNQEYAMPAWAAMPSPGPNQTTEPEDNYADSNETGNESGDNEIDDNEANDNDDNPATSDIYPPGMINPSQFPEGVQVILGLTLEAGYDGARVRDGPGTDSTVIEMLWGYDLITYLGHYVPDADMETLYWLRVRTPLGTVGYIASQLVEVVE
ncbi:MAG: SH3 domain-containing protein [Defluviitaleaceae bacterium]|nr:SH3 domain-containing protein [Defluviitaleaceae bacterium]